MKARLKECLFMMFKTAVRPLMGRRLGLRIPLANRVFYFMYRNLGRRENIRVEAEGVTMSLDPRSTLTRTLVLKNSYEEGTTGLIKSLVKPGMIVMDVGANIGYYSLIMAGLVGEGGKVFAFEPAPDTFSFLTENIGINSAYNVIPLRMAASDFSGTARLYLAKDPCGHRLLEAAGQDALPVEVTTVDEVLGSAGRLLDLIKIDVEGAEMSVIRGMKKTIQKSENLRVIMEFCPAHLRQNGVEPAALLECLGDYGFTLHIISERDRTTKPADIRTIMEQARREELFNIYCARINRSS